MCLSLPKPIFCDLVLAKRGKKSIILQICCRDWTSSICLNLNEVYDETMRRPHCEAKDFKRLNGRWWLSRPPSGCCGCSGPPSLRGWHAASAPPPPPTAWQCRRPTLFVATECYGRGRRNVVRGVLWKEGQAAARVCMPILRPRVQSQDKFAGPLANTHWWEAIPLPLLPLPHCAEREPQNAYHLTTQSWLENHQALSSAHERRKLKLNFACVWASLTIRPGHSYAMPDSSLLYIKKYYWKIWWIRKEKKRNKKRFEMCALCSVLQERIKFLWSYAFWNVGHYSESDCVTYDTYMKSE